MIKECPIDSVVMRWVGGEYLRSLRHWPVFSNLVFKPVDGVPIDEEHKETSQESPQVLSKDHDSNTKPSYAVVKVE